MPQRWGRAVSKTELKLRGGRRQALHKKPERIEGNLIWARDHDEDAGDPRAQTLFIFSRLPWPVGS